MPPRCEHEQQGQRSNAVVIFIVWRELLAVYAGVMKTDSYLILSSWCTRTSEAISPAWVDWSLAAFCLAFVSCVLSSAICSDAVGAWVAWTAGLQLRPPRPPSLVWKSRRPSCRHGLHKTQRRRSSLPQPRRPRRSE